MQNANTDEHESAAATEFDDWARSGRAESMADGHGDIVSQILDRWTFGSEDDVLDVGCGNGWAVRDMMSRGAGHGTGVDIAPEMVAIATPPGTYCVASGERLPFAANRFSHILSVESLYYYADPKTALREWRRVAQPGGRLAVMMELFAENPAGPVWQDVLDVEVHLLAAKEWVALAKDAGWPAARAIRIRDRRPAKSESAFIPSIHWPTYPMYARYRAEGALVITSEPIEE